MGKYLSSMFKNITPNECEFLNALIFGEEVFTPVDLVWRQELIDFFDKLKSKYSEDDDF